MNPGQTTYYAMYKITGEWDPNTMQLSVKTRTFLPGMPHKYVIQPAKCPSKFGNGPLFATHQYGSRGEYGKSLIDGGGVSSRNIRYIGEVVNNVGQVHSPFIAKIAFNPYAGQTIEENSVVFESCDGDFVHNHRWRYRTISHINTWGAFQDVWRTGLQEFNSDRGLKDLVYNYVYQKNKGLVNLWYGELESDKRTVINEAYELYAIN